jgi:translation initiation factor IF-1
MIDPAALLTRRELLLLRAVVCMLTERDDGGDGRARDLAFDDIFERYPERRPKPGSKIAVTRAIVLSLFGGLRLKLHLMAGRPMIERVSGRGRGHRARFRVLDIDALLELAERIAAATSDDPPPDPQRVRGSEGGTC